ncbi:ATP-binding protein, partial [bacterium]|nr:ATP-binding protein [bacterium]
MAVDNKYDPRLKDLKELQETLVIGEKIVEDILHNLKPSKGGKLTDQSWILTGARGSGKSHVLTLLYRKINEDSRLSRYWLPLSFPEELFKVDSLYRLLMVVIEIGMKKLGKLDGIEKLETQYNQIKSKRLSGSLKDKDAQKHKLAKDLFQVLRKLVSLTGKKWILMIENLQEVLNKKISEDDAKHLRSVMHEHPEMFIIVGSALTVFDAIENYGKPFYHFFRLRHLNGLTREDMVSFLRIIAKIRNEKGIEQAIEKNRAYIYTFHLLTGGNPRLVLFLYELLMDYETLNTALILEKITELTPYFRDKTTEISSQRQLIIDALASETPAQTVTEIAKYINEDLKSVSVQCSRMASEGWLLEIDIQAQNVKKKETFYALRDYFYRIWFKMRTGTIDESDVYCMAELSALLFDRSELEARMDRYKRLNEPHHSIYQRALALKQDKRFAKNVQILYSVS